MKEESPRSDYFSTTQNKLKEFNNHLNQRIQQKCKTQIENLERIKNDEKIASSYDKAFAELAECQFSLEFEKFKYNNMHGFAKKLFLNQTKLCMKECQDKLQADKESQGKCFNKCVEDTEKYTIRSYGNFIIPELQNRLEHI
jgi:hypothetical protein